LWGEISRVANEDYSVILSRLNLGHFDHNFPLL